MIATLKMSFAITKRLFTSRVANNEETFKIYIISITLLIHFHFIVLLEGYNCENPYTLYFIQIRN